MTGRGNLSPTFEAIRNPGTGAHVKPAGRRVRATVFCVRRSMSTMPAASRVVSATHCDAFYRADSDRLSAYSSLRFRLSHSLAPYQVARTLPATGLHYRVRHCDHFRDEQTHRPWRS